MEQPSLIKEKVGQAQKLLREFDMDCWITFARETSINGDPALDFLVSADLTWESVIILSASGDSCAFVGQYDKKMVEDTAAYDQVIGYVEGMRKPFLDYMTRLAPRRIGVNFSRDSVVCDGLTHGMYLTMVDLLSEIDLADRLTSAEEIVSALRQRKTGAEIEYMQEAIRHTEEVFELVRQFIRPGMTEEQIAAFMRAQVEKRGLDLAWEPKVCPSVFSGPDTAGAHYKPTERLVQPGHILNMDFGVKFNGYCSDLQRTFYILKKDETQAPPEVQKGFDTIVSSIKASRNAIWPGAQGRTVDAVAREMITEAGYEEFPHALGHQVGRFAHDGTAILGPPWEKYGKKPSLPLEKGMVFTIEPRLTVQGRGIATVEEMVVVTGDGADYLSTPQEELWLIASSSS
ncbi:MAG: Xaa-Pro peptidase family protein [Bacteroidota bacterium]